jgi:hypothetical protein
LKTLKIFIIIILPFLFLNCGDPNVDLNSVTYEPKIAVEGYIYANQTVANIKIMRNYRLGSDVNLNKLYLTPEDNSTSVTINGTALQFDPLTKTYYNNSILVEPGKTYTLEVSAVIDGKKLQTESVTTVPQKGFSILSEHVLGTLKYNQEPIVITYTPSAGTEIYLFSILARDASVSSFIYTNPYVTNIDSVDVRKNINDYKMQYQAVSEINSNTTSTYTLKIDAFRIWFYGSYRIAVYAGDINFKNYFFTSNNVEEDDGNFHEPIQVLKGDGIGVFASAIKDTIVFNIIK